MICTVRISLEGLPERVQEIADVLDKAIPDAFEWHDFAALSGEINIILTGSSSREGAAKSLMNSLRLRHHQDHW